MKNLLLIFLLLPLFALSQRTVNTYQSFPVASEGGSNYASFDGVDGVITLTSDINLGQTYSINFWVNINSSAASSVYLPVIGNYDADNFTFAGFLTDETIGIHNGNDSENKYWSSYIGDDTWWQCTFIVDGVDVSYYANGSKITATLVFDGTLRDFVFNCMGSRAFDHIASTYLYGGIDDVSVFNTALDGTAITALGGTIDDHGEPVSPVAYYTFDNASGSNVPDEAGSNDGTISGGVTIIAH